MGELGQKPDSPKSRQKKKLLALWHSQLFQVPCERVNSLFCFALKHPTLPESLPCLKWLPQIRLEHVRGAQGQKRQGQDQTILHVLQRPELSEGEKNRKLSA